MNLNSQFQEEALSRLQAQTEYWPLALKLFQAVALRVSGRSMVFATARPAFFDFLTELLQQSKTRCTFVSERSRQRIIWREQQELSRLRADIKEFLAEMPGLTNELSEFEDESSRLERETILQMLYLAIGAWSEPSGNYHLELSFPRILPADICLNYLQGYGLHFKYLDRPSARVLYLKDGREIGLFLQLAGCVNSYMDYEDLRVEKEVKNQVNRVVNCDSANADRLAEASARQFQAIEWIKKRRGLELLPEKLRAAAQVRLANPGLNLAELGQKLDPPLGKSGMNHRLKKIEEIAAKLK